MQPAGAVEAVERQGRARGPRRYPACASTRPSLRGHHRGAAEEAGQPLAEVLEPAAGEHDADQDLVGLLDALEDPGLLVEDRTEHLGDDALGPDRVRSRARAGARPRSRAGPPAVGPGPRCRPTMARAAAPSSGTLLEGVLAGRLPGLDGLGVGADEVVARGRARRRAARPAGRRGAAGRGRGPARRPRARAASGARRGARRRRGRGWGAGPPGRWQLRVNQAAILGNIHHEATVIALDSVAASVRRNHDGTQRRGAEVGDGSAGDDSGRPRSPSDRPRSSTAPTAPRPRSWRPSRPRSTSRSVATPTSCPVVTPRRPAAAHGARRRDHAPDRRLGGPARRRGRGRRRVTCGCPASRSGPCGPGARTRARRAGRDSPSAGTSRPCRCRGASLPAALDRGCWSAVRRRPPSRTAVGALVGRGAGPHPQRRRRAVRRAARAAPAPAWHQPSVRRRCGAAVQPRLAATTSLSAALLVEAADGYAARAGRAPRSSASRRRLRHAPAIRCRGATVPRRSRRCSRSATPRAPTSSAGWPAASTPCATRAVAAPLPMACSTTSPRPRSATRGACRDRPPRGAQRRLLRLREPHAGLPPGGERERCRRRPRSRWPPSSTSRSSAAWASPCPTASSPTSCVVAIRADDDDGVAAGLAALDTALAGLRSAGVAAPVASARPRRRAPSAARSARGERHPRAGLGARPARHRRRPSTPSTRGVSVMLFSDNVPVEDEVRLKDAAAAPDVLVMGPDCGTAVVGGVALGFANVVERGPVGIVAASGTGAQQVMALLDAAGVGVSHCLGVGGRDLSVRRGRPVDPSGARRARGRRGDRVDPRRVEAAGRRGARRPARRYAAGLGKPVHWATLGAGRPDLTAAVEAVPRRPRPARSRPWPAWEPLPIAATLTDPPDQDPDDPSESADGIAGGRAATCGGCSAAARWPTRRCWSPRGAGRRASGPTSRSRPTWPSTPTCAPPTTSSSTSATTG